MKIPKDTISLPTKHGPLQFGCFESSLGKTVIVAFKEWGPADIPYLRLHSSCIFSESFGTIDCDCSLQLDESIEMICQHGGAIVYRYDEGRGLGIKKKIEAIKIQNTNGIDTKAAFEELGYPPDLRTFTEEMEALDYLNFPKTVKLLSRNPLKRKALDEAGFRVVESVPFKSKLNDMQIKYLNEKTKFLGHYE